MAQQGKYTPGSFALTYGSAAARAGKALGVDPSLLLGQWGLETGWGKSVIPGTNNLGNIKDFSRKGTGVAAVDNATGSNDRYRQYASQDAFADDFVSLMQRRYPGIQGAGGDAGKFTQALVKGGYAEDPAYASKVIGASRMVGGAPQQATQVAQAAQQPAPQAAAFTPLPVEVKYPGGSAGQATPMGNYALTSTQGTPDQSAWQDFQRALPSQRVANALAGYGVQPQQVAGNQYPAGQDSAAARALWRASLG